MGRYALQATLFVATMWIAATAHAFTPTQQDSNVLVAVVQGLCRGNVKVYGRNKYVVLSSESSKVDASDVEALNGTDKALVKSLANRNRTSRELPRIKLCPYVKRFSSQKLSYLFSKQCKDFNKCYWKGFYQRYPEATGITYVSLPGYSDNGQTAIVLVVGTCDWQCGNASYWVLKKINGKWVFDKSIGGWIS